MARSERMDERARARIVDLSHPLDERIPMFPGLPAPRTSEFLTREASRPHYAGGTSFVIHRYELTGSSGTYLDAPFHRYADGVDLAGLPLEATVDLPGVVVDVAARVAGGTLGADAGTFADLDLAGRAVLVRSGWDARWDEPSYLDHNPHVTEAAARLLAERGAALVGIDSWNIDDTRDGRRPAHSILLRAGIPIVENLCRLVQLTGHRFRFSAAPLPFRGGSAIPVRAYALLDGSRGP
jgi:kynurenine formamidase